VLGDLLGRGGMAEVFAGYSVGDHGFQKPVAIKRLLPELANDEVFVDRLIEEAKLLVGMQHGQIVSVLDLAREGDDVFLVMEFVDGPSLRQLIKARGSRGIPLGVATYVVQAAAAGLEFAHARPGGAIIHADISPSNLLLTTSGEVRVADFGIARREGYGQGVVEGKWAYMAPEQARGESLTPSSDVFALGVVLYELLTGQHPFGRAVSASQRDDQMRVIPPRVVKPSLPLGLDAICMRALAHDPRDRYPRMQTLIDALVEERYVNGYREGASDLAQAIREVAPKSPDVAGPAAPRTMHTERPITLMTRSLLREVTPARRPSRPSSPPAYPMGPLDPPPRDAFPMHPTTMPRLESAARLGSSPALPQLPPAPSPVLATPATPIPAIRPSAQAFDPASGEQTFAREVDQVALAQQVALARAAQAAQAAQLLQAAQAAQAAAAMFQLPGMMRADGTPIPPFRMPVAVAHARDASELGEELASVVGGHTVAGGGAAGVAVEDRGNRWTIAILAAAAMAGVVAAVAFQLKSDHNTDDATPTPPPPVVQVQPTAPVVPSETPDKPAAGATETPGPEARQVTLPPAQPIADDPSTAPVPAPAAPDTANPAATAPVAAPANPDPTANPAAVAAPVAAPANPAAVAPANPVTAAPVAAPANPAAVAPVAAPANPAAAAPVAPTATPGGAKKPAAATGHRKSNPGILQVSSSPWSWVTVGDTTKETPDKFYLAPGSYRVSFHNEKNGLVKTERVTIEAGKMQRLDETMDR
jgi:serine/threonine protein kinase